MNERTLSTIRLEVSLEDIEEMYDRYDSGMCDIGTANAISIALRKRIQARYGPVAVVASSYHTCEFRIGEERFALPQSLYWWLRESECGIRVEPLTISIVIYSNFLIRKRSFRSLRSIAPPERQRLKAESL
jgi:hypothetical protein